MIDLDKKKFVIIIFGIAIIGGILFFILFLPLVKQLKIKGNETMAVEAELLKARNIAAFMKITGNNTQLTTGDNFTVALDTLIKRGGLYHIDFISTKSKDPIQKEIYTMFPVEVVFKSSYKDLGDFLGSLDNLSNSIVKVSEIDTASVLDKKSRLITKLTLNMYFLK